MPIMPNYIKPPCAVEIKRVSAHARGYTSRWQRVRKYYLAHNPLCAECLKSGEYTAANVVDHIQPHRGDRDRFWDKSNWQALCEPCHNRKTAKGQ